MNSAPKPTGQKKDDQPAPQAPVGQQAVAPDVQAELAKWKEAAARAQADLQNAKARMQKDGDDIRKFASEMFIMKLLPTIENFQRAMQHRPEELKDHEWVKGITATEQELMRQMSEMGLKKMECMGQPADPLRHEILLTEPGEEGIILDVLEDGYELHGKVLRPAKVKVGVKPV